MAEVFCKYIRKIQNKYTGLFQYKGGVTPV